MKIGLVSVTFRELSVEEIINVAKNAGLECIEWGADVHVLPGDIEKALKVAKLMKENGLETVSYGSYYRVGQSKDFETIIETAIALETKNIRIWAGVKDSEEVSCEQRKQLVDEIKSITSLASKKGLTVSFEYHGWTLTNTQESTVKLLEEVNMDEIFTYWQPLAGISHEENLNNLKQLNRLGKLKNIHAYHWVNNVKPYNWVNTVRLPLIEGKEVWQEYIDLGRETAESILLEFVKDDSIDQFYEDAKILKEMMRR